MNTLGFLAWLIEAFGNGHRIAFDMPADVARAALQVPGVGVIVDVGATTKPPTSHQPPKR